MDVRPTYTSSHARRVKFRKFCVQKEGAELRAKLATLTDAMAEQIKLSEAAKREEAMLRQQLLPLEVRMPCIRTIHTVRHALNVDVFFGHAQSTTSPCACIEIENVSFSVSATGKQGSYNITYSA